MIDVVRCKTCGKPVRDLVPECESCALRRIVDRDLTAPNNGYARRDLARERVDFWRARS